MRLVDAAGKPVGTSVVRFLARLGAGEAGTAKLEEAVERAGAVACGDGVEDLPVLSFDRCRAAPR